MEIEGEVFYVYVLKRPGAEEFLERMYKCYEIVIYTASLSIYADPLLDEIDPSNFASYRLFREHCTFNNNAFVKDLSVLGRDLKDVIIVDNSPASYSFQPDNAVPILTWIDDMSDIKLAELAPVLELLVDVSDVRNAIRAIVQNDSIDYIQAVQILQGDLVPEQRLMPLVNTWTDQNQDQKQKQIVSKKKETSKKTATQPGIETNKVAKVGDIQVSVGPMTPQYKSIDTWIIRIDRSGSEPGSARNCRGHSKLEA